MNKVLNFIKRRFPIDLNWLNGNCYYFALILADRFNGTIYYDVINGHFITHINGNFYDWTGIVYPEYPVEWDTIEECYDALVGERVRRDCIK